MKHAFFEEVVEFVVDKNSRKKGKIIAVDEDKAVIQVFDSTDDMSLKNTHMRTDAALFKSSAEKFRHIVFHAHRRKYNAKFFL